MTASRNTFSSANGYQKVLWSPQIALLDFDLNEAQDILRDMTERVAGALFDGVSFIGSAGLVTPSATARSVDVAGGLAVSGGKILRVPTTAALAVFPGGASGTQTATVYIDWADAEITGTTDPNILDTSFGDDGTHRTKRTVSVLAVAGTTLPSPATGHTLLKLATVVHNFAGGGTLFSADVTMEPYGLSAGEMAGVGVARPMRFKSNAPQGSDAYLFDTRIALTSGTLARLRNNGVDKVIVDFAGNISIGTGAAPTAGIDTTRQGKFGGLASTDHITLAATKTVDGVDLDVHAHDGTALGGPRVVHSTLSGLGADDHAQYLHLAVGRVVTAQHVFAPTTDQAPFLLGPHALGNRVVGLNADQLDGLDSTAFAQLGAAQNITGAWQVKENLGLDTGKTIAGIDLNAMRDTTSGIGHGNLSGLASDHHTQYLHTLNARTVAAVHTFNPATVTAPFALGANARGQLIAGLNAEKLGGSTLTDLVNAFINASGDVMSGVLQFAGGGAGVDMTTTPLQWNETSVRSWSMRATSGNLVLGSGDAAGTFLLNMNVQTTKAVDANRVRAIGNLFDTTTGPGAVGVSDGVTAVLTVAAFAQRALLNFIRIDPAAYAGAYDVKIYADNNTTSELLVEYLGQTGILEDKVPLYFINARSDGNLYVQITKTATSGTVDQFHVGLRAERFA